MRGGVDLLARQRSDPYQAVAAHVQILIDQRAAVLERETQVVAAARVVAFTVQGYLYDAVNSGHSWQLSDYLRWSMIQWYTWAALAPLVFQLGERFPIRTPLQLRSLGRQLLASVGVTALAMLNLYPGIQRKRFGDRLTTRLYIDPATLDCAVPSLLLQPIVENAIQHGIGRHAGADCVEIESRREDG